MNHTNIPVNPSNWTTISVDCDFPGGNILVDRIEDNQIFVRQDIRDTGEDWFYWYFRVRGAAGQTIQVNFTGTPVVGVHGPAVSLDGGHTWNWLGRESGDAQHFTFAVPAGEDEVRFCFAMPYLEANLNAFLAQHLSNPHLRVEELCVTEKGRSAELIRLGVLQGEPRYRILFTARHHACEMMASYALEGIMATILEDSEEGEWFRTHASVLVVPFIDKDGVEQGDQGKRRLPYDHSADYDPAGSLYTTTRALREVVPQWADGRIDFILDLHDPGKFGSTHEDIYFIGRGYLPNWKQVDVFSALLEQTKRSPLTYRASNNLTSERAYEIWKLKENPIAKLEKRSFQIWVQEDLPVAGMFSTLELPYANASGSEVNPATARAFGRDLAHAVRLYLEGMPHA